MLSAHHRCLDLSSLDDRFNEFLVRLCSLVYALEYRVIPELKEAEEFIEFRLEEMERENIFRLKRIKQKAEARA